MNEGLFPQLAPDQPRGLGTAMAGGKGRLNLDKTERRELDFYQTPADCTRALILAEAADIGAHGYRVWECCGRGGAIARVLHSAGFETFASDIVPDPGNQVAQLDVLQAAIAIEPIVITNPPFALAPEIIAHLLGRMMAHGRVSYLALLLKQTFWQTDTESGRGRIGLFRQFPQSRRWDLTWRPDFTGGGSSTMPCSWFIWDSNAPRTHAPPCGLLSRDGPIGPLAGLFTEEEGR
jgi:hypothetical protein